MNLIATLIGWGVPAKYAKLVAIAAGILLLALTLWGAKALYDRSVVDHHEAKIQQRAAPATDQAATERANDAIAIAKNDQERHDVIEAQPDQPIAPTSRALACKRLHDAGRNPAACR